MRDDGKKEGEKRERKSKRAAVAVADWLRAS